MGVTRIIDGGCLTYSVLSNAEEQVLEPDGVKLASDPEELKEDTRSQQSVAHRKRSQVPIHERTLLTLEEAAEYTGLGTQKLRDISNQETCTFVLWNGTKRMFKRKKLDAFLAEAYSI